MGVASLPEFLKRKGQLRRVNVLDEIYSWKRYGYIQFIFQTSFSDQIQNFLFTYIYTVTDPIQIVRQLL